MTTGRVVVVDVAALLPDPGYQPPVEVCAREGCGRPKAWRVKGGPRLFRVTYDWELCAPCAQAELDRRHPLRPGAWISVLPCAGAGAPLAWPPPS